MAASVAIFGRDLLAITFAQHLLGIGTAALTFGIGRLTFGRTAGLLAGLGAALASPLLIYEHYLITESLFTFFLTPGDLPAGRRPAHGAAAACSRPAASRSGLASLTPPGRAGRPAGAAVRGAAHLPSLAPEHWSRSPWLPAASPCWSSPGRSGTRWCTGTAGAASMGRFLISRSVKHERNFVFYEASVGAYPGEAPERTRARKIAQDVTDKRPSRARSSSASATTST